MIIPRELTIFWIMSEEDIKQIQESLSTIVERLSVVEKTAQQTLERLGTRRLEQVHQVQPATWWPTAPSGFVNALQWSLLFPTLSSKHPEVEKEPTGAVGGVTDPNTSEKTTHQASGTSNVRTVPTINRSPGHSPSGPSVIPFIHTVRSDPYGQPSSSPYQRAYRFYPRLILKLNMRQYVTLSTMLN